MKGFTSRAIHGLNKNQDVYGAIRRPVYDTASFEFANAADMEKAFKGQIAAHSYSRITNPSVAEFEEKINLLAGGIATIAVSSGMAAIANIILTLGRTGDNIVLSRYLFGHTTSLSAGTFREWGLETRIVDPYDIDAVSEAIDTNTRLLFIESISNPQMGVADFSALKALTVDKKIPLVVDNTVTTSYLFDAHALGVDIEMQSATKYLSGGGTTIGGVIIDHGTYDWSQNPKLAPDAKKYGRYNFVHKLRSEVYRNLGACMTPHNAYLLTLGIETLALRIERSCVNALVTARHLEKEAWVQTVNYPGLASSPYYSNAEEFLPRGFGGILTFDLESREQCFAFMDALKLIKRATNINDNKSLMIHPASTIFTDFSAEQKEAMKVGDATLRFSVGIEDIDDILEDLSQAWAQVSGKQGV